MKTYQYIDTQGQMQDVQAADAGTAMRLAQNIGQTSGVMEKRETPTVQSTQDIRTEGMTNSMKLDTANTVVEDKSQGIYSTPDFKKKLENIEDGGESSYIMNTIIPQMEQTRQRMQGTANRLVQNIEETFANRISQMEETNRKQLQYEETVGMRTSTGRSRYAPVMQKQILTDEEQKGVLRISELETQMNDLIIKAEQARDQNDIQMLNSMMNAYQEAYTQTQNAIKELYTVTKQEEEARIKQQQEERKALQEEFKMETEKAEALAPTLNSYIKALPANQQEEFISQYAAKMGLDADLLYGAIQDYSLNAQGKELSNRQKIQSMSIQQQQNARSAQANARANEKHQKDMTKEETHLVDVDNILSGIASISDVSSSNKSKVIAELRSYGLYESRAPEWFKEYQVDKMTDEGKGMTIKGDEIDSAWTDFKTKALGN